MNILGLDDQMTPDNIQVPDSGKTDPFSPYWESLLSNDTEVLEAFSNDAGSGGKYIIPYLYCHAEYSIGDSSSGNAYGGDVCGKSWPKIPAEGGIISALLDGVVIPVKRISSRKGGRRSRVGVLRGLGLMDGMSGPGDLGENGAVILEEMQGMTLA